MKLTDREKKIIKCVEEITLTNYEVNENGEIDNNNLTTALEELLSEYNYLMTEFKQREEFINENYKQKGVEEDYE